MIGLGPYAVGIAIGTVTTVGIERWQEGDLAVDVRPTKIVGFPAVVAKPAKFTDYCSVEVDAAEGQLLDVQFSDGGRKPAIPQDELLVRSASRRPKSL